MDKIIGATPSGPRRQVGRTSDEVQQVNEEKTHSDWKRKQEQSRKWKTTGEKRAHSELRGRSAKIEKKEKRQRRRG